MTTSPSPPCVFITGSFPRFAFGQSTTTLVLLNLQTCGAAVGSTPAAEKFGITSVAQKQAAIRRACQPLVVARLLVCFPIGMISASFQQISPDIILRRGFYGGLRWP